MAACSLAVVLLVLVAQCLAQEDVAKDVTVLRMARELDLTSQVVKQKIAITIQNSGVKPVASFLYVVDPSLVEKLVYVGAQVKEFCTAACSCGRSGIFDGYPSLHSF